MAGLDGPLLVIAGGDGKGQDFSPLAAAFEQVVAECGFTMDQIRNRRLDDERDPAA